MQSIHHARANHQSFHKEFCTVHVPWECKRSHTNHPYLREWHDNRNQKRSIFWNCRVLLNRLRIAKKKKKGYWSISQPKKVDTLYSLRYEKPHGSSTFCSTMNLKNVQLSYVNDDFFFVKENFVFQHKIKKISKKKCCWFAKMGPRLIFPWPKFPTLIASPKNGLRV